MAQNDFTTGLSDFGGAVSDLFAAKGSSASAGSFDEASAIANRNASIAREATGIQEMQQTRQIYQVLGKQKAGVGGAGFAESGTALDLLRSSASQGALAKAITAANGAITENSYLEQAGLYGGMAASARATSTAENIGGVLNLASGALNIGKSVSNLFGGSATGGFGNASTAGTGEAVAGYGGAGDVAGGGATFGTAGELAALPAGAGMAAGNTNIIGASTDAVTEPLGLGSVADAVKDVPIVGPIAQAASWIICTELHRQGRMPSRRYYGAATTFLSYPERGKRGYYVWAIPSVRHLRAHPQSLYSRLMESAFNFRSQYICDRKSGRRGSTAGAVVTHGLYAFCWALSWFVPKRFARWESLNS